MDNQQNPSIDFTTESPTASSDKLRVSATQGASADTVAPAAQQPGVALGRLSLQLTVDEFVETPVVIEINAGNVDIAQLGVAVVVNGTRLDRCQAVATYHVALPSRLFKVGDNQVELVRAPLQVHKVSARVPTTDDQKSDVAASGLPFGLTLPDRG